jgi:hypothetical protein
VPVQLGLADKLKAGSTVPKQFDTSTRVSLNYRNNSQPKRPSLSCFDVPPTLLESIEWCRFMVHRVLSRRC